jgi:hypothetical protein
MSGPKLGPRRVSSVHQHHRSVRNQLLDAVKWPLCHRFTHSVLRSRDLERTHARHTPHELRHQGMDQVQPDYVRRGVRSDLWMTPAKRPGWVGVPPDFGRSRYNRPSLSLDERAPESSPLRAAPSLAGCRLLSQRDSLARFFGLPLCGRPVVAARAVWRLGDRPSRGTAFGSSRAPVLELSVVGNPTAPQLL